MLITWCAENLLILQIQIKACYQLILMKWLYGINFQMTMACLKFAPLACIKTFQRTVYPIIQRIFLKLKYEYDPFVQQWNDMQQKYAIHEKTMVQTLKHYFKFVDVQSYAVFTTVSRPKSIYNHPTHKTDSQGFDYGLIP